MTTSSWPNSTRRCAAAYPAEPVPTTTVVAVMTGTSRPAMVRGWGSWVLTEDLLVRGGARIGGWLGQDGDAAGSGLEGAGRQSRTLRSTLGREPTRPPRAAPSTSSQGGDVHAAVDVDDVAGGVGHLAGDELGDRAADVGRLAPARDRRAAASEEGVVLLLDAGGHVGGDDPGRSEERRVGTAGSVA